MSRPEIDALNETLRRAKVVERGAADERDRVASMAATIAGGFAANPSLNLDAEECAAYAVAVAREILKAVTK